MKVKIKDFGSGAQGCLLSGSFIKDFSGSTRLSLHICMKLVKKVHSTFGYKCRIKWKL
jgi:hypothetical protein